MGTKGHKDDEAGFSPWHAAYKLEKYNKGLGPERPQEPDEVIEFESNLLMNAGITVLLGLLIGDGSTDFDDTNGYLGVGNSSTAAGATQTDLQGASKTRVNVDSIPTRSSQTLTFVATFGSAVANFAWEEVGIFNASSGGTMLSRRVSSLGTKASGATWVLTV
ncbi:hypothetical protein LCGC14_2745950, partial [marine sediment metagenome]